MERATAATRSTRSAPPASQEALNALLREVLPPQGAWNEAAYLWLTDQSNRLIEVTDGRIEELPMPTSTHQAVLLFLYDLFRAYLKPRGGIVMVAALRMRIRAGTFREPDLLLLRDRADRRYQDRYWLGADLVAEVVSPDNPDRDLVERNASTTRRRAFPNTGSPTRGTRRSPCSPCRTAPTSSMARTGAARRRGRRCSPASPPTWAPCSTPRPPDPESGRPHSD